MKSRRDVLSANESDLCDFKAQQKNNKACEHHVERLAPTLWVGLPDAR